ncbi:LysR family transcriptional regulator [Intestinimonas aquisgranensis]|nr:LysR family transcriptional regulator [Intestinimonas aquisgranensis]
MDLNKLRYVVAVADEHNFSRAAKKLFISQPSLSQSIQSLEKQIGVELFDRKKVPLQLTDAGMVYVDWARKTLDAQEQMERQLAEIAGGRRRHLTIGLSMQRSALLMPEVVSRFYKKMPGCDIIINERWNVELIELLENSTCDLIIGAPYMDSVHYTNIPLIRERLLLAAPKDFLIPHKAQEPFPVIEKAALAGLPVVMLHREQYIGQVFRTLITEINCIPKKVTICGNLETAHKLAAMGIGVTILPEVGILGGKSEKMRYYVFQDRGLSRVIAVIYPRTRYFSKDARCFIETLQDTIRECSYPFDLIEMEPPGVNCYRRGGRFSPKGS